MPFCWFAELEAGISFIVRSVSRLARCGAAVGCNVSSGLRTRPTRSAANACRRVAGDTQETHTRHIAIIRPVRQARFNLRRAHRALHLARPIARAVARACDVLA